MEGRLRSECTPAAPGPREGSRASLFHCPDVAVTQGTGLSLLFEQIIRVHTLFHFLFSFAQMCGRHLRGNYSITTQGMVSVVLSSTPKQRRQ